MILGIEVGKAPNAPARESEMQDTPPCQYPQTAHFAMQFEQFIFAQFSLLCLSFRFTIFSAKHCFIGSYIIPVI